MVSIIVPPSMATLVRRLGLLSSIGLVIGITIGGGIFRTPAGIATRVPDPMFMLGVWVLGGVIVLCGALAFAELSAAMPETGGMYVYLREGWGRPYAFLYGWAQLVLIRAAALGGISSVFGEYFLRVFGIDPVAHPAWADYLAAGAIIFAGRHQHRRRPPGRAVRRPVDGDQVRRAGVAGARLVPAGAALGGSVEPPGVHRRRGRRRAVRPGADLGDVGLRRLRRPHLRQRRGHRPAAQPAARHHHRHGADHRHLPAGQRRLPLCEPDRPDGAVAS